MTSTKSFYLLEPFHSFPVDDASVRLGRIVTDYRSPIFGYTRANADAPIFKFDSDPNYSNIKTVIDRVTTNSVRLSLLDVFGISNEAYNSQKHSFSSRKVERLRLHQDADILDTVLEEPEVEAKLKKWGTNVFTPLFLVVGLLVTDDVSYDSNEKKSYAYDGDADPVQITSLAAGVPLPLPLNSSIGGGVGKEVEREQTTRATGRRTFAVEYRSFRTRLIQRPGHKRARIRGRGPQGNRAFDSTEEEGDGLEARVDFDMEPFSEIIGEDNRSFDIEETSGEVS